jgi:hypothetical protein
MIKCSTNLVWRISWCCCTVCTSPFSSTIVLALEDSFSSILVWGSRLRARGPWVPPTRPRLRRCWCSSNVCTSPFWSITVSGSRLRARGPSTPPTRPRLLSRWCSSNVCSSPFWSVTVWGSRLRPLLTSLRRLRWPWWPLVAWVWTRWPLWLLTLWIAFSMLGGRTFKDVLLDLKKIFLLNLKKNNTTITQKFYWQQEKEIKKQIMITYFDIWFLNLCP